MNRETQEHYEMVMIPKALDIAYSCCEKGMSIEEAYKYYYNMRRMSRLVFSSWMRSSDE